MLNKKNLGKIAVLTLLILLPLVSNVTYAGLGKPLPVEDESSRVAIDQLRDALLKESRIGGEGQTAEKQLQVLGIIAIFVLIILLIAWALGGLEIGRPKGKWQIDKEKAVEEDAIEP